MTNPNEALQPLQGLAGWLRMKAHNCSLSFPQDAATLRQWAQQVEDAQSRTSAKPCATCGGTKVVSDGEITHSESGVRYENGPVVCIKDCPDCTSATSDAAMRQLLAEKHSGMRVDYSGLLKQARAGLRSEPALAEMLRQLQEHLQELGKRWYAGDIAVVDEILQLYCIESDARAALHTPPVSAGGAT